MSESIDHMGIIEKIDGNLISVKIVQQSACSGCHAKSMCTASDSKEKIIEVTDYSGKFNVNDTVIVCGESSLGLQAVLFAFVTPLIIIVLTIALGTNLQLAETESALLGLFAVVPYYGILYMCRNKLKKKFVFTLKKT
ncbi:MAG: SoxR reducing system RseC family protein [Parabacteroides sp.]|jgi:positive regulator of sigma E activity|nr:SoxR reducing system RseC family protein [Parabacteroides sp.]